MEQGADGCRYHAQSIGSSGAQRETESSNSAYSGSKATNWASDGTAPALFVCVCVCVWEETHVDDAIDDAVAPSICTGRNPLQSLHVTASDRPKMVVDEVRVLILPVRCGRTKFRLGVKVGVGPVM